MKKLAVKILICSTTCLLLGIASGYSTAGAIKNWYQYIVKPDWNPPNWLFGPVWTILYLLMGVSLALVWHKALVLPKKALILFIIQFILNLLWSYIFFNKQQIGYAFVEIACMLLFIVLTTISFYRINKTAAYLMLPYLFWVCFATVLNGTIWYLNKS
ncbi:tryptophan-rich sensory protein [Ferruginibacter lapsinanis]|uniref:TspO/MBR family protein n=1 Tax=Ferruginibacter lapsinanis TaxID=563172 RepID=UPI001E5113B1|nr:TspO/MBR family protein [Ferruginibacter lapsinanis]UEG49556.1 tryptophan-rich sensory protein [Ferruginibacter lapsinanis]